MAGNPREGGFTLLEILVAFIIAAIGIAALVQGASGGLGGAQAAAHYQEAVSRAQSRLALLAAARLQPGEQRGDDGGGYSWRVFIQPGASTPAPQPPAKSPAAGGGAANPTSQTPPTPARAAQLVLYAVSVTIGWALDGGDRQVTLYSQRLGLSEPEGP